MVHSSFTWKKCLCVTDKLVPRIKKIGFSRATVRPIPRMNQTTQVLGLVLGWALKVLDMVFSPSKLPLVYAVSFRFVLNFCPQYIKKEIALQQKSGKWRSGGGEWLKSRGKLPGISVYFRRQGGILCGYSLGSQYPKSSRSSRAAALLSGISVPPSSFSLRL